MIADDTLLAQFGSPLYVYDLDRVTTAAHDLLASVPEGTEVLYSLKANPHPELVATLRAAGCGAEVSSTGELASALAAGFAGQDLLYGGPAKTIAELRAAITVGVHTFSVESSVDLRRVGAVAADLGTTARCLLRINGSAGDGGAGLRMTGAASQFGFDMETAPPDPTEFSLPGVEVTGLHFFPLTNAADEADLAAEFASSVRTAAELADRWGLPLRMLDLGGGFACPYAVPGSRPGYPGLRDSIETALHDFLPNWRAEGTRITFESGRYLVGDSGRLLCTVMDVKKSRENRYAVLDAGVNHIGGLSGIGRLLPLAARPLSAPDNPANQAGTALSLVGPLCTPADVVNRSVSLADPRPGQLLAIPNVGAYGVTASLLGFLSRPAPGEVLTSGGNVVSVSRLELTRTPFGQEHIVGTESAAVEPLPDQGRNGRDDRELGRTLRAAPDWRVTQT
jgi:diaminopimelate decarboxylase